MSKLMRAELFRLKRSLLLWIGILAAMLDGAYYALSTDNAMHFDDFGLLLFILILATVLPLYLSREYGDGTIRNKLVAGHSRSKILLSWLVNGLFVTTILTAAFLLCTALGFAGLDAMYAPAEDLLKAIPTLLLANYAWAVFFVVLSSQVTSRALCGVVNILAAIAIAFLSYGVQERLNELEYIYFENEEEVQMTPQEVEELHKGTFQGSYRTECALDGTETFYKYVLKGEEKTPNPQYVSGAARVVLIKLDQLLGPSQMNHYSSYLINVAGYVWMDEEIPREELLKEYAELKWYPLYSLGMLLLLAGGGLLLFRRKEIR